MRKTVLAALALTFISLPQLSVGEPVSAPCRYAMFKPDVVYRQLLLELPKLGLAVVGPELSVPGLPAGRINVVRAGAVVGQIEYTQDIQHGTTQLTVWQPVEKIIKLQVTENETVCGTELGPTGLCHRIQAFTDLQRAVDPYMAFVASWGPLGDPPRYLRYSAQVDFATFSSDFAEAIQWLKGVFLTTPNAFAPALTAPVDIIRWAMASDPLVAPYISRFVLFPSPRDPRVIVIKGVAPSNEVYGHIIDRARDAGFPFVDPQMIIDTRTLIVPAPVEIPGCPFNPVP